MTREIGSSTTCATCHTEFFTRPDQEILAIIVHNKYTLYFCSESCYTVGLERHELPTITPDDE